MDNFAAIQAVLLHHFSPIYLRAMPLITHWTLRKPLYLVSQLSLVGMLGLYLSPALAADAPTTSPAAPPQNEIQPEDDYLLGAGDRIRIDFFNVTEYSGEYQVLPNGTVNLPQVGGVSVQGKTLKQASDAIALKYEPYLTRPIITISLLAARPITIAIAGEVNRPGSYTVPAAATADSTGVPTVTRIIKLAGGTTQVANIRQIQIRRLQPGNVRSDERINVDLSQLVEAGDILQDIRLRDGDSIVIPSLTTVDLDEAQRLATTSFSSASNRPLRIAVVGEVNRPGPYTLTEKPEAPTDTTNDTVAGVQVPTVTQAIQTAGGITQSADIRNIEVRRMTRTGPDQQIKIDFWQLLQAGDLRQDLPLQDGDTIVIPTATTLAASEATKLAAASFAPNKITVNVVGEVTRPGPVEVPPNTPLNQALLAAGGFNNRAKKSSVTFIRLNPNGTVSQRKVSVDFAQGINEDNPALRNNDTIVVGKSTLAGISDAIGSFLPPTTGVLGLFRLLGF